MSSSPTASTGRVRHLEREIAAVVGPMVPAGFRVYLFGSRASGRAHRRSDFDIGVVGPSAVDGSVLERMRDALDLLPTLHRFDVVDLMTTTPRFRERALRTAIPLI